MIPTVVINIIFIIILRLKHKSLVRRVVFPLQKSLSCSIKQILYNVLLFFILNFSFIEIQIDIQDCICLKCVQHDNLHIL